MKPYKSKEYYKVSKEELKKTRGIKNIRAALKMVKINKLLMAGIVFVFLLSCAESIGVAYLSKQILFQFTTMDFSKFYIYAIVMFAMLTVGRINDYLYMMAFDNLRMDLQRQLQYQTFERINMIKIECFSTNQTSTFTRRLSDASEIVGFFDSMFGVFDSLVRYAAYCVMLLITSPLLFLISAVLYFVKVICSQYYTPKTRVLRKRQRDEGDKVNNIAMETIRGMRDVRSLNMTDGLYGSYVKSNDELMSKKYGTSLWNRKWTLSSSYVSYTFNNFVFMMLSAYLLIEKSYDAGIMLYFWSYRSYISSFFSTIFDIQKRFTDFEVPAQRLLELYNEEKFPIDKFGNTNLDNPQGEIEFKDVSFSYENSKEVLNGINLKIKPHEVTAFVGKTGCGKSTVLSLIAKFYDVTSGDITIDGVSVKDLSNKTLRSSIGYVQQDPYIFNRSFKENLKLVKPNATDEELEDACEKAQIHDFIMSTKDAYNTLLGEDGITLSGGQKQRLAIARALLGSASIIMFDESTSSLDNENQAKIQDVIEQLSKDHTIIVVAHRLSTIINADKILFMEDGKIKAEGTHSKLYKTCQEYKNLYKMEMTNN